MSSACRDDMTKFDFGKILAIYFYSYFRVCTRFRYNDIVILWKKNIVRIV